MDFLDFTRSVPRWRERHDPAVPDSLTTAWLGKTVRDLDDHYLGVVEDIWLDQVTHEPLYIMFRTRKHWFGRESLCYPVTCIWQVTTQGICLNDLKAVITTKLEFCPDHVQAVTKRPMISLNENAGHKETEHQTSA